MKSGIPARNLRGALAFGALTVNTIVCCLPLFLLALLKLVSPGSGFRRALTRGLTAIGEAWVSVNAAILRLRRPGLLEVRGLEGLSSGDWYLVIANHRSWTDVVLLQTVFNRRIPFLKFFLKQELLWFPFLGVAWWALDMPFMKRYPKSYLAKHPDRKGLDLKAAGEACSRFRELPTTVISFVEGTRFSTEKKAARQSPYEHLLPPKAGGIASVLAGMGGRFAAILDVTIVYRDGPPGFWDLCRGTLDNVLIDVRARPVEEWMLAGNYAQDRQYRSAFHRWLKSVWAEKDALIAATLAGARLAEDSRPGYGRDGQNHGPESRPSTPPAGGVQSR